MRLFECMFIAVVVHEYSVGHCSGSWHNFAMVLTNYNIATVSNRIWNSLCTYSLLTTIVKIFQHIEFVLCPKYENILNKCDSFDAE